jgi:hypothetical protein
MLRMESGALVFFFCNTQPLAELDKTTLYPPLNEGEITGLGGEDVFTNRDANHAAISFDEGKTWQGFREMMLNPLRNESDFRTKGGNAGCLDKSVHQFQAFELPFGKVLVSAGQNGVSRRLLIFDVGWLYETSRREDFLLGLDAISTHTYVRSISGCTVGSIGNGHCAWNRAPSAYLMPDPDGGYREMLYICKRHDDRLWSDVGGATWNFPASKRGRVTIELRMVEGTARLTLTDRWYNPCDPYAGELSPFSVEPDAAEIGTEPVQLTLTYDTEAGRASVAVNGVPYAELPMRGTCETGISYLLLQCATEGDCEGFYVKAIDKQEI